MTRRESGGRRMGTLLGGVVIVAGALTGCAPSSTDLSQEAALTMQQSVASVADSAAAGDPATALATLDRLQAQLDSAIAEGDVSAARAAAIQSAIDLVRIDLQPAPVPAPESTNTTPVDNGGDDAGTDAEDADQVNENSGPENGNGNGNGNGPGNNNGNGNRNDEQDKGNGKGKEK